MEIVGDDRAIHIHVNGTAQDKATLSKRVIGPGPGKTAFVDGDMV